MGKVENQTVPWKIFKDGFIRPVRTNETYRDYLMRSDAEQKALKGLAGFWYRAPVSANEKGQFVRSRTSGQPSNLISFDFDYATPAFFAAIRDGTTLKGLECFIQTSRRHSPEKPRFRLVVLAKTPIPNELYGPVSRVLARKLDPAMRHVDKVSFRVAQMMFMPTASVDAEYVFQAFEGEPHDWEASLAQFQIIDGDYRDLSNLPRTPDESNLRETADKAEDPTEKKGVVGDFCRAYDVPEAIAKFLPDIYAPVDLPSAKPRYTYLKGSTTNGAEVEDGGLFLYSHHGTDPTSEMLVNSFDLVRIHLFGHLDAGADPDLKVTALPSWTAMLAHIADDPAYQKSRFASNYDTNAMFDDLWDQEKIEVSDAALTQALQALVTDDAKPIHEATVVLTAQGEASMTRERPMRAPPPSTWTGDLEMDQFGKVKSNLANVARILAHDMRFRDSIAFNEFENRPVLARSMRSKHDWLKSYIISNPLTGEAWQDHHDILIRATLEDAAGAGKIGWGMKVSDRDLKGAVVNTARLNTFNPVREALSSFKWDGVPRLDGLFIDYLGAPDTAYHREAARLFMIAAVARVFEPGHKFDYAPVLIGAQGLGKSTFIKTLAMEWFGELTADFSDDKKLAEQMIGCFIMELPELTSMVRSEIEPMKAFMAGTQMTVRMSYDRSPSIFKRQCVFIGSTNKPQFLKDETGNRRFWPIMVNVDWIDLGKLRRHLGLLWAEAVVLYREMRAAQPEGTLPLTLSTASTTEAMEAQTEANSIPESEIVAGTIKKWIDALIPIGDRWAAGGMRHRDSLTVAEIIEAHPNVRSNANLIAAALERLGWEKSGKRERRGSKNPLTIFVPGQGQLYRWALEEAADLL